MQLIKYSEFKEEFGIRFIRLNLKNFPERNFLCRARGNVYWMFTKPGVFAGKLEEVEREANGKEIKVCIVPNNILKYAGIA